MNKLNWLFTLTSISVLLVTIERFSPTTKILLQPYNFLRFHELLQMTTLILLTVVIPALILKEITDNFETLKSKNGATLFVAFIVGVYFYATGNGLHEVASFTFNNFCNVKNFVGDLCGGLFFNDYYTGNILYFIGAFFMNLSLLLLERQKQTQTFSNRDLTILLVNGLIYSLAIFAYSGFDRVLVGLVYSAIVAVIADALLLTSKLKYKNQPVAVYTAVTYTLGTVAALLVRIIS